MKFKNIIAKTTFRTLDNATCGFAIAEHFGFTPKTFDHIVRVSVLLQKDETTNQLIIFLQSGNPILDSILDKSFGSQDAFKPWLVEQQTLKWQDIQEFWDFYDDLVEHVQDDIQTNYKLLQPKANPQFVGPEIPISDIPDINDFRVYSDPKKEPETVQNTVVIPNETAHYFESEWFEFLKPINELSTSEITSIWAILSKNVHHTKNSRVISLFSDMSKFFFNIRTWRGETTTIKDPIASSEVLTIETEKYGKVIRASINLFDPYFSGDIWVVRGLISDMQDLNDKYGIKNTIHLSKFFDKILNVLKLIDSLSDEADKN